MHAQSSFVGKLHSLYREFVRFREKKNERLCHFGCYLSCATPPLIIHGLISKYSQQKNYDNKKINISIYFIPSHIMELTLYHVFKAWFVDRYTAQSPPIICHTPTTSRCEATRSYPTCQRPKLGENGKHRNAKFPLNNIANVTVYRRLWYMIPHTTTGKELDRCCQDWSDSIHAETNFTDVKENSLHSHSDADDPIRPYFCTCHDNYHSMCKILTWFKHYFSLKNK